MLPITLTFFAHTQVNLRAQVWTSNQMHILNNSLLSCISVTCYHTQLSLWDDGMTWGTLLTVAQRQSNHLPFLPTLWPSPSHLLLQIVFDIAKLLSCTVNSTKELNNNLYFLSQKKMICTGEKWKTSSWRESSPEIFLLLLLLGIFSLFIRRWNFS